MQDTTMTPEETKAYLRKLTAERAEVLFEKMKSLNTTEA